MKKIFSILTAMCMLMGMIVPAAVLAADEAATTPTPWLNETFDGEGFVIGETIHDKESWTITTNSDTTGNKTTICADPAPDSLEDKAVKVELNKTYDTNKDGNKYAKKDLNKELTDVSYILFEHKVRFANAAPRADFHINFTNVSGSSNAANNIQLAYNPSRTSDRFYSSSGGGSYFGGNVEVPYDKWLSVKVLLNVSAQTYDLYVDNVKINDASCSLHRTDKIAKLTNVQFGVFRKHGGSGNVYFDDVVVTPLTDASAVEKEIDDARMAKMKSDLTAYTLTGQKYVIDDFTANLTGVVNTDTVTIESDNNAFAYNASTKAVTITQGTEDKIANLTVTVTSAKGSTFTKNLKVYIPSVSDVKLNEGMNYSSFENATGWSLATVSNYEKGTTYTISASPDDTTDKVLDAEVVKLVSEIANVNNQTARWSGDKAVSGQTIIQANFKFADEAQNQYLWYIRGDIDGGSNPKDSDNIIQLVLERQGNKLQVSGSTICENAFPTNEWFNLKIVLDTEKGTYDIYIDNVKKNQSSLQTYRTLDGGKIASIKQMDFGNWRKRANPGHMYVDDIMVRVAKPAYKITGMIFANDATTPVSGGKIEKISIIKNTEETVADAKAIVAVYDKTSGKLLKTSTPATVSATGDITIEMDLPAQDNLKACAFLWKMNTLVPLAEILEK